MSTNRVAPLLNSDLLTRRLQLADSPELALFWYRRNSETHFSVAPAVPTLGFGVHRLFGVDLHGGDFSYSEGGTTARGERRSALLGKRAAPFQGGPPPADTESYAACFNRFASLAYRRACLRGRRVFCLILPIRNRQVTEKKGPKTGPIIRRFGRNLLIDKATERSLEDPPVSTLQVPDAGRLRLLTDSAGG